MGRSIVTDSDVKAVQATRALTAGPTDVKPDEYSTRLIKYIPAEVVTIYVFVDGIIKQANDPTSEPLLLWLAFGVILALTPLYLWRVQKVEKWLQIVICTLSFAVWVFSLGGPFAWLGWYKALYGAVLLPLFTFVIGIVEPTK
jgi:hypothetical protein